MKKRTLSFLLALVMCLTLLPMTALAVGTPDPAKFDAPIIADLAITEPDDSGSVGISFTLKNPDSIKAALAWYEADDYELGWIQAIIGQVSIDGGEWYHQRRGQQQVHPEECDHRGTGDRLRQCNEGTGAAHRCENDGKSWQVKHKTIRRMTFSVSRRI